MNKRNLIPLSLHVSYGNLINADLDDSGEAAEGNLHRRARKNPLPRSGGRVWYISQHSAYSLAVRAYIIVLKHIDSNHAITVFVSALPLKGCVISVSHLILSIAACLLVEVTNSTLKSTVTIIDVHIYKVTWPENTVIIINIVTGD